MSTLLKQATLAPVALVASGASLANGVNAATAVIDFSQTNANIAGYGRGYFQFAGVFGAAPAPNSSISIYALLPTDGTLTGTGGTLFQTYLGTSTRPVQAPVCVIPLDSTNTTQAVVSPAVFVDPLPQKVIVMNDATLATLNSTWTLSFVPCTDQGV